MTLNLPHLLAAAAPPFLAEAAVLILAGALIAYAGSRFGVVPIVGFLLAGVLVGPNCLGLVHNQQLIDGTAELGVIFLLFTIGLEFSLDKLARIRRLIFLGGGLQVGLATALVTGLLVLAGVDLSSGVYTGFLVALSSTAIVLKLLAERRETRSESGQVDLGLLIFQDVGIIVMVMLVPVLAGQGGSPLEIFWALGKAGLIIVLVLTVARRIMPKILERVALTCSPEIFLLSVIAICLGVAWLTSLAGVSVSLGAFLAGLLVSESRFSEHAFGEILPLQILFSATFFVSVGMLLDLRYLIANPVVVLLTILAVLTIKILTTGVAVLALGYRLPVAAGSALMLAQVGEFSFVLERAGREVGLYPAGLPEEGSQAFIAATVLLMVMTPSLGSFGSRLANAGAKRREEGAKGENGSGSGEPASEPVDLKDHVIIAGYAGGARRLATAFAEQGLPFVITTLSPGGADEAEAAGHQVLRGDASRSRTLEHAGIEHARVLIIADDEPTQAHRIATVARSLRSDLKIGIRTRFIADGPTLHHAGADMVASEELESVLELCSGVLSEYGMAPEAVAEHAQEVREKLLRQPEQAETKTDGDAPGGTPAGSTSTLQESTNDSAGQGDASNTLRAGERSWVDLETPIRLDVEDDGTCSHLHMTRAVLPSARGCEECLAAGDRWVHLRVCMTCGHVGCCDSSPNRHAARHAEQTGHPIIRSLEPGETWAWCFIDKAML